MNSENKKTGVVSATAALALAGMRACSDGAGPGLERMVR